MREFRGRTKTEMYAVTPTAIGRALTPSHYGNRGRSKILHEDSIIKMNILLCIVCNKVIWMDNSAANYNSQVTIRRVVTIDLHHHDEAQ